MSSLNKATEHDIPHLITLVNSAYRGEKARQGWTHEANLIKGDVRIDEASLQEMITRPDAAILICQKDESVVGCVYLEKQQDEMYLGMLTVSPMLQGSGMGKELLKNAERFAKENGCNAIIMNVISVRTELIEWYKKQGYKKTGITKPFPNDNRFGTPVQPLQFEILRKEI